MTETLELVKRVHETATRTSVADTADYLQDVLSRRLVAYMAGVKDAKNVSRWAKGEGEPRVASVKRLRVAYEIVLLLRVFDTPEVIKAWFIGLNPQLGDESPADAIREDRLKEALAAARAFVSGG